MGERIWANHQDGQIYYRQLSAKDLEETMKMMEISFWRQENVCRAVGIPNDLDAIKELSQLHLIAARDGVSVVAVDKSTNRIVAAALNTLHVRKSDEVEEFEVFAKSCKQRRSIAIMKFLEEIEKCCDLFEFCKVDCLFDIMFVGVLPEYRKRGLARRLCEISVEMAEELGKGVNLRRSIDGRELRLESTPKIVGSMFTSVATQKIGKQLGFQVAAEKSMEELMFDGRSYASVIGKQPPSITVEYKLIK